MSLFPICRTACPQLLWVPLCTDHTLFPSVSTLLTIIWDVPLLPTWDDSKMSQLIYKSARPTATKPLPSSNSSPSWGCAPSSDSPLIQSCVKPAPLVPDKLTRRKVRKRKVEEETGLIMNWRTQTHWSTNLFRIWMIAEYSIHLWYHSLQMYSSTLT